MDPSVRSSAGLSKKELAIRQAREDLGNHRIEALPRSGNIIRDSQKIPEKDLGPICDALKAWRTDCIEDLDNLQNLRPGIGKGDSHRYGPNYKPDLRLCTLAETDRIPPYLVNKRDGVTKTAAHAIRNAVIGHLHHKKYLETDLTSSIDLQKRQCNMAGIAHGPSEQIHRITVSKDSLARKTTRKNKKHSQIDTPLHSSPETPARINRRNRSKIVFPGPEVLDAWQQPKLVENPFWNGQANVFPCKDDLYYDENTAILDDTTSDLLKQLETTNSEAPLKLNQEPNPIKQSSKGYLQERGADVPSHYKEIVFPAIPFKKPEPDSDHETFSTYCPTIYSDAELRPVEESCRGPSPSSRSDQANSANAIGHISTASDEAFSHKHEPEDAFIQSMIECREDPTKLRIEKDVAWSSQIDHPMASPANVPESLLIGEIELAGVRILCDEFHQSGHVDQVHLTAAMGWIDGSKAEISERGPYLFKIKLEQYCVSVYENDDPNTIAMQICDRHNIHELETRSVLTRQILVKYWKMLRKHRLQTTEAH